MSLSVETRDLGLQYMCLTAVRTYGVKSSSSAAETDANTIMNRTFENPGEPIIK